LAYWRYGPFSGTSSHDAVILIELTLVSVLEGGALSPPPTVLERCGDDKASPSIE
jgi:hypothetical protein